MDFELIVRNFSSPCGGIDPTMRYAAHIAFIEVRYHRSDLFGGAIQSSTATKQR